MKSEDTILLVVALIFGGLGVFIYEQSQQQKMAMIAQQNAQALALAQMKQNAGSTNTAGQPQDILGNVIGDVIGIFGL